MIVDFPNYKGPPIFKNHPTFVPLVPTTAKMEDMPWRRRTQIPLRLCFAMSIHKSQGLTLDRVVVDLGKKENALGGITYVALSRLKTFEGLYLKPMDWVRLQQINNKVTIKKRMKHEAYLQELYQKTRRRIQRSR